jgi:DNA-binding LytR/AlgR family response regulator
MEWNNIRLKIIISPKNIFWKLLLYYNYEGVGYMLKIAICDDDISICTIIEEILLKYSKKTISQMSIEKFYLGTTLINSIKEGNTFDLIYLDIEMEQINGVKVGKYIREELSDQITEIVYISGSNQYDRQLFAIQPLSFIPKPIKEVAVIKALSLCLRRKGNLEHYFHYQKGRSVCKIPIETILYFEKKGQKIRVVTTRGEDEFYGSTSKVLESLPEQIFIQINRYIVINYNHAFSVGRNNITLSNHESFPIGRSKKEEFLNFILENEGGTKK